MKGLSSMEFTERELGLIRNAIQIFINELPYTEGHLIAELQELLKKLTAKPEENVKKE
jgi:hypothetical protein